MDEKQIWQGRENIEKMAGTAKALYSVCFKQTEREVIIKFNLDSAVLSEIKPVVLIIWSFQNAVCLCVCALNHFNPA